MLSFVSHVRYYVRHITDFQSFPKITDLVRTGPARIHTLFGPFLILFIKKKIYDEFGATRVEVTVCWIL